MVASTKMIETLKGAMGEYTLAKNLFDDRPVWEKHDKLGHYLWHNTTGKVTWMVSA